MIYFRLCFSFSWSGYYLTLIKKSHTLNFYLFFLLLVTAVAQFNAETTNSEKAIYFLSLISCSLNKLKSHIIHMQKFYKNFVFSDLTWKKNFCLRKWWRGWRPPAPFLYGPIKSSLFYALFGVTE